MTILNIINTLLHMNEIKSKERTTAASFENTSEVILKNCGVFTEVKVKLNKQKGEERNKGDLGQLGGVILRNLKQVRFLERFQW